MGRRSKGNSSNEHKKHPLGVWTPFLDTEVLRTTPGLSLKTPTTFSEAAVMAKLKERERHPATTFQSSSLAKRNIFGDFSEKSVAFASDSSDNPTTDVLELSGSSRVSSSASSFSQVAASIEGEVSRQILCLPLDSNAASSDDSFASDPQTHHNRGAIAFLDLVEKALVEAEKKDTALKFETLVVDMMEIGLEERIPTTEHISQALNCNGWSLQQVASIWKPSMSKELSGDWNDAALEQLGGKGSITRIWHELKDSHLCGFPKRAAPPETSSQNKRMKLSNIEVSTSSNCNSYSSTAHSDLNDAVQSLHTAVLDPSNTVSPRFSNRRKATARR